MMALLLRRLGVLPFQVLGVVSVAFILLHLIPGNPAYVMAGPLAPKTRIHQIDVQLGLTKSLPVQYYDYIRRVVHGNLGVAWHTSNPVLTDIKQRGPATFELITLAVIGIAIVSLLLTSLIILNDRGFVRRFVGLYGFAAGALPDFWVGLGLIFLIYFKLGIGAAPSGQISPEYTINRVTGFLPIDALIAGNTSAFFDALGHLVLPVLTLVIVYSGFVIRLTAAAATRTLNSEFMEHAVASGITRRRQAVYAIRHDAAVFVTALGATYASLLGGAVLVETVFSWGGIGEYAVDAIRVDDTAAVEGFVIAAGIFVVLVYTAVDLLQTALNPRLRH
jgi:peptide/nickel transport system permease protein